VLRQSGDGEASSSVIAARPGRTASLQFQRTLNDEQKEGFVHFVKIAATVQIVVPYFQIEAAWHHSVWGLEAVKTGAFAPPELVGPVPFAGLQAMIGKAETVLEALTPNEVNSWAGKDLDLQIGPRRLAFTSETLILSFSLPNFYFHAVTAYDILRTRGVPLGKRDYEGRLRTRTT
jgi:hypothetical protein